MKKYKLDEIQKHKPKYKKIMCVKRPFGVEIEVGSIEHTENFLKFDENVVDGTDRIFPNKKLYKTSWQFVNDRSINDYSEEIIGYEFVSPILSDTKETWKELKHVCKEIKRMDYFITNKCGAHVHIDGTEFASDPYYLLNLYKLWIAYEDVIFNFGYFGKGPRESIERYSVPVSMGLDFVLELLECARGKRYKTVLDYLYLARSSALNIANLRDEVIKPTGKNTIEFRCANGTLKPLHWQQLVKFYQSLLDYSMSPNFDEEYIDRMISKQKGNVIHAPLNLDKAIDLSDLIYEDDETKLDFLHIYSKKLKK